MSPLVMRPLTGRATWKSVMNTMPLVGWSMVALLGVVSAGITFAFMALVHQGTHVIWVQTAEAVGLDSAMFTLLVCTLGGLLIELLLKRGTLHADETPVPQLDPGSPVPLHFQLRTLLRDHRDYADASGETA